MGAETGYIMSKAKTRCVHIFPRFENNFKIEEIRKKYDNLYCCIEPHITLVFPFESNLETEKLSEHINNTLESVIPFRLIASGIEGVDKHGCYLFLKIGEGKEKIIKLHYKMHEGILSKYQSPWTKDGFYIPHITVGRFETQDQMRQAAINLKDFKMEFRTIVDRIYIEEIGENEESIIEKVIKFGK